MTPEQKESGVPSRPEEGSSARCGQPQWAGDGDDDQLPENSMVWLRPEERWELTWPIWHMLPRHERKELAHKYGYNTIGEFEEFMSLQRAVGDSNAEVPYENSLVYSTTERAFEDHHNHDDDTKLRTRTTAEEVDDESVDGDAYPEDEARESNLTEEELYRLGGMILMLPDDMLHKIFEWLPVDTYANLALVSPHWKSFTRTEAVYKRLCERLYLKQSKRKSLHVHRFGDSYRLMLQKRPRVKAGGGVYVMKYSRVKPVQRDMWTEVPAGAVLEMTYYRYLYFQEDGRVLYALSPTPPHEMFPRFLRMSLTREPDRSAVWGTYEIQKNSVTVSAVQAWQHVRLFLTITPYTLHGRFGLISFDGHQTSESGNFEDWSPDRITYEVPSEPFHFVRDTRL